MWWDVPEDGVGLDVELGDDLGGGREREKLVGLTLRTLALLEGAAARATGAVAHADFSEAASAGLVVGLMSAATLSPPFAH